MTEKYNLGLEHCVAFTADKIYVLKEMKKNNTQNDIGRIIAHEYVHFLQFYTTGLSKKKYLWLYESIACYMAQQTINLKECSAPVSWNDFKENFYECTNNYYWAYMIGKYLFENYCDREIVEMCNDAIKLEKLEKNLGHLFFK